MMINIYITLELAAGLRMFRSGLAESDTHRRSSARQLATNGIYRSTYVSERLYTATNWLCYLQNAGGSRIVSTIGATYLVPCLSYSRNNAVKAVNNQLQVTYDA